MSRYLEYGIDLGTTNSCIARCQGTDVRIFQNNDQMNVTPSVVYLTKSGRTLVGRRAHSAIVQDPANVVAEFKRWMGQSDKQVFPASGRVMSAEELSAEVLKSLREDVRRQLGDDVRSAVVTVPAAFGALQCEATARAARLAGFQESPLLQEPIAAAIAYGASPEGKDQHWLVFDLGGGTLDIAVVSTQGGRLSVLEHRGNNLLGGKDVDRMIVDQLLLPAIAETFQLPDPDEESGAYEQLRRRLTLKAEEAKIDLSTSQQVTVGILDVGDDRDGRPIEMELSLNRSQLDRVMEPLVEKCCLLAQEALLGARISGADLDRILLVGGPTQTPLIRAALGSRLGGKVDHSFDPMTVVARGAAIYATTVETSLPSDAVARGPEMMSLRLAYDPVCASLQCPVAGRIESSGTSVSEIKVDAEGGYWTSGWIAVSSGLFETSVALQEGKSCRFWLYARDSSGGLVDLEPGEFNVRHGLVVSAPPLPHTISVEVLRPNGRPELDPVFKRNMPLPNEQTVKYRADRTLRPLEPGTTLPIKLWEGETFGDPEANVWVGNMLIASEDIRRPVPEGSEIELSIRIDASRLITVDAFIPRLNQHFSDRVYVAQREEQDYADLVEAVPEQIDTHLGRLDDLDARLTEAGDDRLREDVSQLRRQIEDLHVEANSARSGRSSGPDEAKRLVEASREIRGRLSNLERTAGIDREQVMRADGAEAVALATEEVVQHFGSAMEKQEITSLRRDLEGTLSRGDDRGLRSTVAALESLRWKVLSKQDWFWAELFASLREPGRRFLNETEAKRWIAHGEEATRQGDGEALREAVRHLWQLQAKSDVEADQERVLRSGLRRY